MVAIVILAGEGFSFVYDETRQNLSADLHL